MVLELSSFSEKSSSSIPEEELSTVESKSFSVKEEAEEMSLTEVESGVSSSNSGFVSQGPFRSPVLFF